MKPTPGRDDGSGRYDAAAAARHIWSNEGFTRLRALPEARRVAEKYADWSRTDEGLVTMTQLSGLALLLVAGKMSRWEYRATVNRIAREVEIPPADMRVITKSLRSALRAIGQLAPAQGESR